MKVLIVNPSFWIYGGAERLIVHLANYLTEHFNPNTILTTGMIPEIKKDLKETRIIETKTIDKFFYFLDKIYEDFDVINFHNDPAQLGSFAKRKANVWMCNEPPQKWLETGKLDKKEKEAVQKFIKKIVVADEFNKERIKQIYNREAKVINYGIDKDFLKEGDGKKFRKEYSIEDSDFVISQVGFIHPMKNQERTVKIFKNIKNKIPNAKLVLAGYDKIESYKRKLQDYIFENNLQADIIFTGFIDYNKIRDLYHASDVLVQPIKSQGGWLAVFEAMSIGLPVIVSKEMTASKILEENKIGFVEDFEKNLEKIYKEKFRDKKGQEWVHQNLSWDKFCKEMVNTFKEVL